MCVLVLQLLFVFKDYNIVTTVACNKFGLEVGDCEVELLQPKPSLVVCLLDTINLDLDEEENNMKVVQIASADNIMVARPCFSRTEVFSQGESICTVLLRLKSYPQEQPTLSVKGGAPNPYLVYLLPEDLVCRGPVGVTACYWCSELTLATRTW